MLKLFIGGKTNWFSSVCIGRAAKSLIENFEKDIGIIHILCHHFCRQPHTHFDMKRTLASIIKISFPDTGKDHVRFCTDTQLVLLCTRLIWTRHTHTDISLACQMSCQISCQILCQISCQMSGAFYFPKFFPKICEVKLKYLIIS